MKYSKIYPDNARKGEAVGYRYNYEDCTLEHIIEVYYPDLDKYIWIPRRKLKVDKEEWDKYPHFWIDEFSIKIYDK